MNTEILQDHETILLVEDDPTARSVLREQLEHEGYNVLEASNGSTALTVSEHHAGPIHMLVTDLIMPRMNGLELSQKLTELRRGVRVLCLSGHTEDDMIRRTLQYARIAFLPKTTAPSQVLSKVREVLNAS